MNLQFEEYLIFIDWENIFEVMHYRGRIAFDNSITYIIHTKEKGHNRPHIHAQYQKKQISIDIETNKKIKGNLKPDKEKLAIQWVINNKEFIIKKWNELTNGITIPVR